MTRVQKKLGREPTAQEQKAAKRPLGQTKAPPPQGYPATEPGSRAPDERAPGTRERGSPDEALMQGEGANASTKGAAKRTGKVR